MPIWQIQIQEIAVWNSPHKGYVSKKIDEIFKNLPHVFGIVYDILIVRSDIAGKDHENTMGEVL